MSNRQPKINKKLIKKPDNIDLSLLSLEDWKAAKFRFPSQSELDALCESRFLMDKPDGSVIILKTSPKEFYNADKLEGLGHLRQTGEPGCSPDTKATSIHVIESRHSRYFDATNLLWVLRDDDPLFQKWSDALLAGDVDCSPEDEIRRLVNLAEAVVALGVPDDGRSEVQLEGSAKVSKQFRVNIQLVGGNLKDPTNVNDQGFFNFLFENGRFNDQEIKATVADLSMFVWMLMEETERLNTGIRLAPDDLRNHKFASFLRDYIGIEDENFNAESITLVVGLLFPNHDGVRYHFDKKNGVWFGYTRTGVLNMILMDTNGTMVLHIQVCQVCYIEQYYSTLSASILIQCQGYFELSQGHL